MIGSIRRQSKDPGKNKLDEKYYYKSKIIIKWKHTSKCERVQTMLNVNKLFPQHWK